MAQLTSLKEIDLTSHAGKHYVNIERERREEFIYFLMVDRFHDDTVRRPTPGHGRCSGVKTPDNAFNRGKIKGTTRNLARKTAQTQDLGP